MRRRTILAPLAAAITATGIAYGTAAAKPSAVPAAGATKSARPAPLNDRTAAEKPVSGGWWDSRVFYEIFVRSYGDSNGDGIGDLRGATERLTYLRSLGIGAVWLMPLAASSSYHGYSVTDYRNVEPDYGTNDDMRAYVQAAHALDIRVIVDLVINHTSDQHPWFVDSQRAGSPKTGWYRWSKTDPGTRGPWGQQVWHRASNGRYYFGLFDRSQPDLNLTNPAVTRELVDVARFWLTDLGVDGFRLDAASHLIESGTQMENTPATKAWWRSFRSRVKAIKPEAFLIGEVNGPARPAATYVPDGLDATFQFDLAKGFLNGVRDQNPVLINLEQTVGAGLYGPGSEFGSFLSNHDQNRIAEQLGGTSDRARVAAAELLTRPGIPFLYYGEELGMLGHKPDESLRSPMPWTAAANGGFTTGTPWESLPEEAGTRNVETETRDPDSLLSSYRSLIALRREHPALQAKGAWAKVRATVRRVGTDTGIPLSVDAYVRGAGNDRILVVHNLSAQTIASWPGESGPVELVVETDAARVSVLGSWGWDRPTVTPGPTITLAGPIPGSATAVIALGP